ncbi:DUF2726 domain-containing protein [Duffyella gerundensis]|uniref:DUF2726 domain-containing protein n=1 Tax=Duffyella gerundensis TaxID=1619313 RepID=UPI0016540166|nr:DUF2726 domain-containing protein [Duffyella gerundensis]
MDLLTWGLIAAAVVVYLISAKKKKRPQNRYQRPKDYQAPERRSRERAPEVAREETIAERQLSTVRSNEFYKCPLMNKGEYGVFRKLEKLLSTSHRGYRIFAQVSLGEILGSDDTQAYFAINSKRADFVIIDWAGQPVAVVEYHGSGHYKGNATVRDAVKREACKSAGIAFIELHEHYSEKDILSISDYLQVKAA